MNLEKLKQQLIIDEGVKYQVYLDSKGLPTFGVGHLLTEKDAEWYPYKNLPKDGTLTVSKERVEQVLEKDISIACKDCKKVFPDFEVHPSEVQEIIANMMFNLGFPRFVKFINFIAQINDDNYKLAAREMRNSAWYSQVGDRAKRLVARMDKIANDTLCHV